MNQVVVMLINYQLYMKVLPSTYIEEALVKRNCDRREFKVYKVEVQRGFDWECTKSIWCKQCTLKLYIK